jgi:hypothetical protein
LAQQTPNQLGGHFSPSEDHFPLAGRDRHQVLRRRCGQRNQRLPTTAALVRPGFSDRGRLVISGEQRDLLFERIARNLARADGLSLALQLGEIAKVDRLGRDLSSNTTPDHPDRVQGAEQ